MFNRSAHTLLFVDVNGVLNVGVRVDSGLPLALTETNITSARKLWNVREHHSARKHIEHVVAAGDRTVDGTSEHSTYEKFVSRDDMLVSDVLVERLATLIRSIDGNGLVILTSSWRKSKHAARVAELEALISRKLGVPFHFHAKTAAIADSNPGLRLKNIGDFVMCYSAQQNHDADLRILVLDNFDVAPVHKWSCHECEITSISDGEQYLESRVSGPEHACARIIHTYDAFVTSDGLLVELGCGLVGDHFSEARSFLEAGSLQSDLADVISAVDKGANTKVIDEFVDCRLAQHLMMNQSNLGLLPAGAVRLAF